jgi:hypothetical protein
MQHVPQYVKDFLRQLPDYWDNVRFIEGYPGKQVVIARKTGSRWYVCGINGEKTEKELVLDLSFLGIKKGSMITDGQEQLSFQSKEVNLSEAGKVTIRIKGEGGFVMVFQ